MDIPKWTIYCHTHIASGRRYVGLTKKTWKQRWNQHVYTAFREKSGWSHFANAIRKYGKEAFSHEVLEVCYDLEIANIAEVSWIDFYDTTDPAKGFNIAKGGNHALLEPESLARVSFGVRASLQKPSVLANRAAASRRMWQNPEFREKVTKSIVNVWKDPSYQSKMSVISKEVNSRPEVKKKISEAQNGCPKSSRFRGVCWNKKLSQWKAFLRHAGKMINLGHFKDEELAARAYDAKAAAFGMVLNFPV